jgi:tRNA-uridine 2-sulfurtransferase
LGPLEELLVDALALADVGWVGSPPAPDETVEVQTSAHGVPVRGTWAGEGRVRLATPIRRVAAGQSAVLYRGDAVVGGGIVTPLG